MSPSPAAAPLEAAPGGGAHGLDDQGVNALLVWFGRKALHEGRIGEAERAKARTWVIRTLAETRSAFERGAAIQAYFAWLALPLAPSLAMIAYEPRDHELVVELVRRSYVPRTYRGAA